MGLFIVVCPLIVVIFFFSSLYNFSDLASDRNTLIGSASDGSSDGSKFSLLETKFNRSRIGRWLSLELELAEIKMRPTVALCITALVVSVLAYLMSILLAPIMALLGVVLGLFALWEFVRRGQERRIQAFVNQLPELSRVLGNASHAGLSLPTAISLAANEMNDPASTEMRLMATRLRFGDSITKVLDGLKNRIKSREVTVLMTTLLVSSRSGGSLVTALRNIADSLEQRKETRREVQTILSQCMATAYLIMGLGFVTLLMLNTMKPGTVDMMLHSTLGQIALLLGLILFTIGFCIIKRMTKVE